MNQTLQVILADTRQVSHSAEMGWQSDDLLSFNGNKVRYRTMNAVEARWHKHDDTDEMFFVLSGRLEIDVLDLTGSMQTHALDPGQMLTVHPGCEHRARASGLTTLLVFDAVDE